ncbi:MAG: YceH family protein [Pyrinomonadaceae bacterium]
MSQILNDTEVRVVGALIEKQITTPEYYPLTLHALTQACNQKSNRDPIVSFGEPEIAHALESLRDKNLVYIFYGSTSRVPKYKHMSPEIFQLDARELAVLGVLMLRGAQTVGELKERANRLAAEFTTLHEVEETLDSLTSKEPQPLIAKLARQPGQKDARYVHTLAGEVTVGYIDKSANGNSSINDSGKTGRLAKLEDEVEMLRAEVAELRQRLGDFVKQFEA